jgi:putative FmdB family regulatory protein
VGVPTYQYACTECGEQLEAVQSFSDPSLTECPKCSGQLRKVFSAVGVVFKGSGFYKTDSRGNGAKSDSPGKAETKSTESTSSDSTSTSKKAETTSSSTTSTPAA